MIAPPDPRIAQLAENLDTLRIMITRVQDDPDVETVHVLRTATRRSGAIVDSLMANRRCTPEQARIAQKLLRQWKRLRRASGVVRDYDVHRELLAKLGKKWTPESPDDAALLASAAKLDEWLALHRHRAAAKLKKQAARRTAKIEELEAQGMPWLTRAPARSVRDPGKLAVADFARITAHFLALDADNLHDFRKRTKEARYVAEAGHAASRPIERALKRIQDAIGAWHDLDALLTEACRAVGEADPLTALLERRRNEAYRSGLLVTERMRALLMGEFLATQPRGRKVVS